MSSFTFTLMSDLHVDFPQPKTPYDLIGEHVVIAGDTSNGLAGLKFLTKLKNKGHKVFAVPGNHESYANASQGRSIGETEGAFYAGLNQPQKLEVAPGLTLLGTNGWYPVTDEGLWVSYMNDSRNTATPAREMNIHSMHQAEWLRLELEDLTGMAIVVTHTAPCEETLNPQYAGHFSNEWYWNPLMEQVLKDYASKIAVWCHGHTHRANEAIVHGVRVICNPRGYPRENPYWKPKEVSVDF